MTCEEPKCILEFYEHKGQKHRSIEGEEWKDEFFKVVDEVETTLGMIAPYRSRSKPLNQITDYVRNMMPAVVGFDVKQALDHLWEKGRVGRVGERFLEYHLVVGPTKPLSEDGDTIAFNEKAYEAAEDEMKRERDMLGRAVSVVLPTEEPSKFEEDPSEWTDEQVLMEALWEMSWMDIVGIKTRAKILGKTLNNYETEKALDVLWKWRMVERKERNGVHVYRLPVQGTDASTHWIALPEDTPDQKRIADEGMALVHGLLKKNADYGGSAWRVPVFSPQMDVGTAILVRMSDKIERLMNLMDREEGPLVQDETIEDTMRDLAGYAILWLARPKGEK